MTRRNLGVLPVVMLMLAGCAAPGMGVVATPESVPMQPGMAKIVFTRSADLMFMGVPARIDVNGRRVAELWRGESYAGNVAPGNITLSTDAWSTPGRYVVTAPLEPDREYLFQISPRGDHFGTLMTFGVIGAALEANVSENSGPFGISLQGVR